jgi:hypothetical protein
MKICDCPVPTAIGNIITTLKPCPEYFGQTQKQIFWRSGNSIASVATMIVEATWTSLLAADDDTKAVVSPHIHNPATEGGAVKEFGSGNEVRDGIPIILGRDMTKFTCRFYNMAESYIRALKELECESLEVILINSLGWFGHRLDGTAVKGFPISGFFISDRKLGGLDEADVHEVQFSFRPNWSDYLTITDPTANFNALDLINT